MALAFTGSSRKRDILECLCFFKEYIFIFNHAIYYQSKSPRWNTTCSSASVNGSHVEKETHVSIWEFWGLNFKSKRDKALIILLSATRGRWRLPWFAVTNADRRVSPWPGLSSLRETWGEPGLCRKSGPPSRKRGWSAPSASATSPLTTWGPSSPCRARTGEGPRSTASSTPSGEWRPVPCVQAGQLERSFIAGSCKPMELTEPSVLWATCFLTFANMSGAWLHIKVVGQAVAPI